MRARRAGPRFSSDEKLLRRIWLIDFVVCAARRGAGGAALRRRHRARTHYRWHGFAVVLGRRGHSRRPHRGDRQSRRAPRAGRPSMRTGDGGGAGIHRHAGAVGDDDPGRSAPALEDLPGHHDGDHGRRRFGGAAQRAHHRSRPRRLRAPEDHARLDGRCANTLRGWNARAWASIWPAMWARPACGAWCWAMRTCSPRPRSSTPDAGAGAAGDAATARWACRRRCNMRRRRMRRPRS